MKKPKRKELEYTLKHFYRKSNRQKKREQEIKSFLLSNKNVLEILYNLPHETT